jgi:energy-coupling factor transporter transmembrane protein EcfT
MQKYNNIANHMNLLVPLMNIVSVIMIVFFATKEPSIDTIIPMVVFVILLILNSFTYLLLIDHWYFTYYNDKLVIQKWLNKRKRIEFE